ncbi:hypothetical protein M501DRAFT_902386, partial [Patellaria atrata CBS 101060]
MAPSRLLSHRSFDASIASDQLESQWVLPGDVFSVLLILGGDVVARALAQLAGGGLTPVSFSFGWVAYSISALVSSFGENKLMPQDPDCHCKIINGKSGYSRDNTSWILGRMMRDFDHWRDPATKRKTVELLDLKWEQMKSKTPEATRPTRAGLVVTVYQPSTTKPAGVPERDYVYWSGIATLIMQLGIAAVPCGLFGDWGILMITVCGSALSLVTGCLPQWANEKWSCRRGSKDNFIMTRGNGSQHAVVILGNGHGLNLEDLAAGQDNIEVSTNKLTRASLFILATLWILLLISAAGMTANTWFLLAVGAVGIVQNVFVAGWSRRPENFGIPLDFVKVIGHPKVMDTLIEVEDRCPRLGQSMRDEFFPGKLNEKEEKIWEQF